MRLTKRRSLLLAACAPVVIGLALVSRPAAHLLSTSWRDRDTRTPVPSGFAGDASRLELTRVARTVSLPADAEAAERVLAAALREAAAGGLRVSIAGARHSMGGQTSSPGGVVVEMRNLRGLRYDPASGVLRAGAGASWSEAIAFLHPLRRSVKVMQSFASFTVGGSISVNAHGWQHREPPLVSSVISLRMMLADGSVVRCSRDENAELFRAAAGGYGLLGVILEAELATVPDERYRLERSLVSAATLEAAFGGAASQPEAALAFGRLDVGAGGFLERGVFNVFRRVAPEEHGELPSLAEPALAGLRRAIFRGTVGSEYGKRLRWDAETRLAAEQGARLWRNQILDDDVTLYEDRSDATTELLEEYFVPEGRLEQFLAAARPILRGCAAELLNATVRHVRRDDDSLLRYADADMTAIVLLLHLERTAAADAAQAVTSRALIDAALALGGRYYLPYRPNATKAQLAAAYPQAARFFELKRRYDPGETFVNRFYLEYGR